MATPHPLVTTLLGSTIADRYELCDTLAHGGMGTVYGGRDRRLCRPVAIKVIPLAAAPESPAKRTRGPWWWEAWVMAAARHPHVVQIYDAIADHGHGCVVMELVDGDDLKRYLAREGPLPYAEALSIGIQVCRALHSLHARGFIHCDVKPKNILRTPDGYVKLTDFGIAQATRSNQRCSPAAAGPPVVASVGSSGILLGTATYCSPEQAFCDPLTAATDIYSLGVVLYELLAGIPPFSGNTPLAVLRQHTLAPVPAPHHLRPDMPAAIERVILRALAKDPAQRFASARAMCAALAVAHAAVVDTAAVTTRPALAPMAVATTSADARSRSVHSSTASGDEHHSTPIEQQTTAVMQRPARPRAPSARRSHATPPAAAHGEGERGWDGETTDGTTSPRLPATARSQARRTRGTAVGLLCVVNAVGLLLLITLLSWVH